eukprot:260741-Amphidinium_carterae.2
MLEGMTFRIPVVRVARALTTSTEKAPFGTSTSYSTCSSHSDKWVFKAELLLHKDTTGCVGGLVTASTLSAESTTW